MCTGNTVGLIGPHQGEEVRRPVGRRNLVAAHETLAGRGIAEAGLTVGADGGGELVVLEHELSVRPRDATAHRAMYLYVAVRPH